MWGLLYAVGRERKSTSETSERAVCIWDMQLWSNLPYAYPRYMDRVPCDTQAHRILYDPLEKRVREFPSLACAAIEM